MNSLHDSHEKPALFFLKKQQKTNKQKQQQKQQTTQKHVVCCSCDWHFKSKLDIRRCQDIVWVNFRIQYQTMNL